MVDFTGNPYLNDPRFQLSDDQMRQYRLGSLGSALTAFGAGIAGSGASGQPWFAGIAPGAAAASGALSQQEAQLAHMQEAAAKYQQMEDYRKAQEEDLKGKAAERDFGMNIDKYILDRMKGGSGGGVPGGGIQAPPGPMMGPGAGGGVNDNNIGNVRPPGASKGFQQPPDFDSGVGLTVSNARAYPSTYNGGKPMTLAQIGAHWAPVGSADDPTGLNKNWVPNVAKLSGLDPNVPLDLNNPQTAVAFARGVHGAEKGPQAMRPPEAYLPGVAKGLPNFAPPGAPGQFGTPAQMVAQAGTYRTPSGATVDPSISAPAFMGPQGGDAQTQPGVMPPPPQQFNGPPGASAGIDPMTEGMLMSKRFGQLGTARLTNQNQQFTQELERQRFLYQQQQDAEKEGRSAHNADVIQDPVTGQWVPNSAVIDAKKGVSAVQGTDPAGHGLKLLMDQSVKTHGEYQAAAQGARTAQPNLERLNTLISGLDTGKTKEITTDTKAWLKDLGVNLDAFGVLDDTGRAQAAKALGSQLALTLRNPANGGGLPGSMSNYEDKLLQSMSPSLVQTPEGNRILLDALRKQNQRTIELGRVANSWMRENGGKNLLNDPAGLHAVLDKYVEEHPLFTPEDAKKLQSGPSTSMQPAPPAEDLYKRYNLKPAK